MDACAPLKTMVRGFPAGFRNLADANRMVREFAVLLGYATTVTNAELGRLCAGMRARVRHLALCEGALALARQGGSLFCDEEGVHHTVI